MSMLRGYSKAARQPAAGKDNISKNGVGHKSGANGGEKELDGRTDSVASSSSGERIQVSPTDVPTPSPSPGRNSPMKNPQIGQRDQSVISDNSVGGLSRIPTMAKGSQYSLQSGFSLDINSFRGTPTSLRTENSLADEGTKIQPSKKQGKKVTVDSKSLLLAAKRGDSSTMTQLLNDAQHLDLRFSDESGKTLLHHCANSGDNQNAEILLSRGAPVNTIDKSGQTPLLIAAKKDHVEIIEMLAVNGAPLDYPDTKLGQTALHYAVAKNFLATVQILIFSGADSTIKDKQGRSPLMFCRSKEMRKLLSMNTHSSQHGSVGEMMLQTVEVIGGSTTYCERLDVTIDFSTGAVGEKFSIMCRRQAIDFCDIKFQFVDAEEVISDVITYRLQRKGRKTLTKVTVPLYGNVLNKEELVLKSNLGNTIVAENVFEKGGCYYCTIAVDLAQFNAFVIVARVKHQMASVSAASLTISSIVNPKIQLVIPQDTFDEPTKLFLEITEPPNSDILESDNMKDIYSITPFCSIQSENNQGPKKDVQLRLPLPEEYGVGGTIRVFTSNVYEIDDVNESSWSIVDTRCSIAKDIISFDMRTFSVKVAVETKKDVQLETLRPQLHRLFQKSRKKDISVTFLAMSKYVEESNEHLVAIECVLEERINDIKKIWFADGFQEQKISNTATHIIQSRDSFLLNIKNLRLPDDSTELTFQFHPRRRNLQCFSVETFQSKKVTGQVQVMKVMSASRDKENVDTQNTSEAKRKNKLITTVTVHLEKESPVEPEIVSAPEPKKDEEARPDSNKPPTKPALRSQATSRNLLSREDAETPANKAIPKHVQQENVDFERSAKGDPSFKGFTNDDFLRDLCKEMDDEWYKVVVLMGWKYSDIEKIILDHNPAQQELIWHYFLSWRNTYKTQDDLGMPILVTALSKGGRRDLCTTVTLMMRDWCSIEDNQKTKFYRWVNKAFKDSDLMNPGDYPYPLTDQFLVLLVETMRLNTELGEPLGLSKREIDKVMANNRFKVPEEKMLKIVIMGREKSTLKKDYLKTLFKVTNDHNLEDAKRWILIACKKWLEDNQGKGDPFCEDLQSVLKTVK